MILLRSSTDLWMLSFIWYCQTYYLYVLVHVLSILMVNTFFSQKEIEYIKSQRLVRIATASVSSKEEGEQESIQPDVVPVGFDFDEEYFYVGGMNILKSTNTKIFWKIKVAIVINDLKIVDPWDPRGIKIYGTADVVNRPGGYMEGTGHSNPQYIRKVLRRSGVGELKNQSL